MSQSSPSYSPRLKARHHARRVLFAIVPAAGLIAILLIVVVLIASSSLRPPHCILLIASSSSRPPYRALLLASCRSCQLFFVSDTQSNATHVKTALPHVMIAAMGVTLGVCAGNTKCGSSIYRCTLDIKNRAGVSHYAWNPLRVCECDASICCDVLCVDSQRDRVAMTRVVWTPFALTQLRPVGKCPAMLRPEGKCLAMLCPVS